MRYLGYWYFIVVCILTCNQAWGQSSPLRLERGTAQLSQNLDTFFQSSVDSEEVIDGRYYRYLQFASLLPGEARKNLSDASAI